ncbi:MAG TPA: TIGR03067 domain-containing protein [Gemmataceae bacterium]|jgi:uncharacterized protein (TIGR03067 family)|nr:TIGR03067 domain-containing protein [Gemmataceae bacterium]
MKLQAVLVLLLLSLPLKAEPPKSPDAKDELKKFQGVWIISVAEQDGRKGTTEDGKWVFEGDKSTLKIGTQVEESVAKLDPAKSLKWIDLEVTSGKNKGQTYHGIYKFVDDELLLCFPKDTKAERPTEFSGNLGNGQALTVLKRKKE